MSQTLLGELSALFTAIFWTITALAFEGATKRIGAFAVNVIRLLLGLTFLSILTLIIRGHLFPVDASMHAWIWLGLSGIVGFILGDYFLFSSYPIIGSRMAMLLMTLAPPIAALLGWLILGETLNFKGAIGMILVLSGIAIAIWNKPTLKEKMKLRYPAKGLLFGILAAVGQGGGIVLSKYGMGTYNAFAATQIRIIIAIIGFLLIMLFLNRWKNIARAFVNKPAMKGIVVGAFFGPFLGVSFSLLAVQNINSGIASTIMAMVPVFIILPSVIIYKQKATAAEIAGAFLSVFGVALFFI